MAEPIRWDRRGVLRADAVAKTCSVERFAPCAQLEDSVEHFWSVRWDLSHEQSMKGETLPHPTVHAVVEEDQSAVYGVSTERFTRVLRGKGQVFGVRFHPGCFRPFSRIPVHELSDGRRSLVECLGDLGEHLEAAVLAAGEDRQAAANQVEALLLTSLPAPDPRTQQARRIVELARQEPSLRSAKDLGDACGLGLRALQRLFHEYVGASPKWVLQRYRLHEAVLRLEGGEDLDLAGLALELGFSDQAHFTRTFKALVGHPPGKYVRNELGRGPSEPDSEAPG